MLRCICVAAAVAAQLLQSQPDALCELDQIKAAISARLVVVSYGTSCVDFSFCFVSLLSFEIIVVGSIASACSCAFVSNSAAKP